MPISNTRPESVTVRQYFSSTRCSRSRVASPCRCPRIAALCMIVLTCRELHGPTMDVCARNKKHASGKQLCCCECTHESLAMCKDVLMCPCEKEIIAFSQGSTKTCGRRSGCVAAHAHMDLYRCVKTRPCEKIAAFYWGSQVGLLNCRHRLYGGFRDSGYLIRVLIIRESHYLGTRRGFPYFVNPIWCEPRPFSFRKLV